MKVITVGIRTIGNVIKGETHTHDHIKTIEDKDTYYNLVISDNYQIRVAKANWSIVAIV